MTGTVSGAQLRAFIERIERLEEEKRTIADDIKEVKAEAKGCGFDVGTINAILKLRKKDQAERDEEQAMLDLYMSALGMLPLFERDGTTVMELGREPAQSYSEAKGRGDAGSSSGRTADFGSANAGSNPAPVASAETGEIADSQESDQPDEAVVPATAAVASDDVAAQDDAGATASSINSNPQPTKGESDAKSAHDDSVYEKLLTIGAGPVSGAAFAAAKETGETTECQPSHGIQNAPAESAADTISATNSHSAAHSPAERAGEAPSSNPASPATLSDMPISTTPSFAGRVTGEFPDIPDFLRRTERKAREWEDA